MTKLQAEAVARKYETAINVHYQKQLESLRAIQETALSKVQEWVDSRAYRRKNNDRPSVPTYCIQLHLGYSILRTLDQPETK